MKINYSKLINTQNKMENTVENLLNELRIARSNIMALIDNAWEWGGHTMGEDTFNNHVDIKDGFDQVERINELERQFHKSKQNKQ